MLNTKTIGNRIAEARKKMNISQAQLAQQLFITPQAVGKWERGESMPDITTFSRLAEMLGVDLNYFSGNEQSGDAEMSLVEASVEEVSDLPPTQFKKKNRDMSGWNWADTDFSGADLTGTSFKSSNLRDANFDGANLTDCNLSTLDLSGASFNKAILVRTNLSKSSQVGTKFTGATLTDVNLTMTDLRKTIYEGCTFNGVDFKRSDLRGVCFDGQTFTEVSFDNAALGDASFKGATLNNVSFHAPYALTNKYYIALKTICFDDAKMDKLTYGKLKSLQVDMSKVTMIEGDASKNTRD